MTKVENLEKAKKVGSVDELMALASAEGIELSKEKAAVIFSRLNSGELGDEELGDVSGGVSSYSTNGGCTIVSDFFTCRNWTDKNTHEKIPHGGYCKDCYFCLSLGSILICNYS